MTENNSYKNGESTAIWGEMHIDTILYCIVLYCIRHLWMISDVRLTCLVIKLDPNQAQERLLVASELK